jgi:hypothetical protein
MKPTVQFAKFSQLEHVLVAADERSIGSQSQVMLDTIYDLKMYYTIAKRELPKTKPPHIAVGCLGWIGIDGKRLYHANEDNRQLLEVFESYGEMKDHQQELRYQEWKFTRDRFSSPKPSIIAKLQKAIELSESNKTLEAGPADESSPRYDESGSQGSLSSIEPPSYEDVVSADFEAEGNPPDTI